MPKIRCGNHDDKRIYHETVAEVRACFAGAIDLPALLAGTPQPAGRNGVLDILRQQAASNAAEYTRRGSVLAPPAPVAPQPEKVAKDGIYRNPDTREIFKVQWNRASGDGKRLYAKRMVMSVLANDTYESRTDIPLAGDPGAEDLRSAKIHAEWTYVPGLIYKIDASWRMSMEDARRFGALYGTCVRCGRELTAEESIDRAMGPVCANKKNWG